MRSVKIAVTLDQDLVARLDQLVEENQFPSRSRAYRKPSATSCNDCNGVVLARESRSWTPRSSRRWLTKA